MPDQAGDKSQDATPHRRQQAREQGQVAFSQDLGSAILLIVAILTLMMLGGQLVKSVTAVLHLQLGTPHWVRVDRGLILSHLASIEWAIGKWLLPITGILFLAAVLASVFQVGFLFVPSKLAPDLSKISPLRGFKRIFSLSGAMRLSFGLLKVIVIVVVAGAVVWSDRAPLVNASALAVGDLALYVSDLLLRVGLWVGVALLILAILDYAYQRWKHEQDIKMTTQEVREEMKNLQGDPQVIARRRLIQRQMIMNRLEDSVPKADVVVTNPTELAVAIQYEPATMAAPVVVAKGAGVLAQRIRRLALEHGIPIVERKPLARLLYRDVDVNHPIPDDTYATVAEVLAYVYQLKGKAPPKMD